MSEQSAKPYLVRAICEWCADNGLTPYLAVRVDGRTRVPLAYVKNGEIVLNISATATRRLTVDNETVHFNARFNGVSQEIVVPMDRVCGIFAKETGYGFAFVVAEPAAAGPEAAVTAKPPAAATSATAPSAGIARVARGVAVADEGNAAAAEGAAGAAGNGKNAGAAGPAGAARPGDATGLEDAGGAGDGSKAAADAGKPRARPSHLSVIK